MSQVIADDANGNAVVVLLDSQKRAKDRELAEVARDLVDTPYAGGGKDIKGVDCSGLVNLAFRIMGYRKVPYMQASELGNGKVSWLNPIENPSKDAETKPGMLNFFRLGSSGIVHVNIGAGLAPGEEKAQIVDATSSSDMQQRTDLRAGQYMIPKKANVNMTYGPWPVSEGPAAQATVDWDAFQFLR